MAYEIPKGFELSVLLGDRFPLKGEACFGFAIGSDGSLYHGAMGEFERDINITMVKVRPTPEQAKSFKPVGWDEIEEAEWRTDLPKLGEQALGWYYASQGKGKFFKVLEGVATVQLAKESVPVRLVRPFAREDPRHFGNWPRGLYIELLQSRAMEAENRRATEEYYERLPGKVQGWLDTLEDDEEDTSRPFSGLD
ncbi:uncharacterized protein DSM5745_10342 [Aspergillus mulundensis]|uniref:Uncharacterized protein n=1 Tax=Aspergillus mulundensis TaxID=1810919 RepID=A0A3D8QND2_9EURO|nr:hypothetical protein DSM5745_10342 [Aspergillus mulundensis]RDW63231.1 hypothetical protein DSM5745_10342 [Aspergillus mulundensis]